MSTQETPPAGPAPVMPWLAAGAVMLMWASSFVVIRGAAAEYTPGAMTLLRCVAAALTLLLLVVARRVRWPRRPGLWGAVVGWGILWFGLYSLALNGAERHIDAATAAMLVNLAPLLVAVFAGLFLGERMGRLTVAGIAVAFTGVALITVATSTGGLSVTGMVLALLAALMYAGAVLIQKRLLTRIDSTSMTVVGVLGAAVAAAPLAGGALLEQVGAASPSATAAVVYMGVFPTAVAFLLWGYALSRLPAGLLTSSSLIVPAIALALSWALLQEVPGPVAVLGGALCVAGVGFVVMPAVTAAGGGARRRRRVTPARGNDGVLRRP